MTKATKALIGLTLLSLALGGRIYDPNGGYHDRGYGDRNWNNGGHVESHAEQSSWDRH
jgi:hypothetical protein